jgi:hypothetical protein
MHLKWLSAATAICTLELMTLTLPAQANSAENWAAYSDRLALQRAIDGLQRQGNNFFNIGQERFEQEIERLLQRENVSESPLLTIDESVLVKPEDVKIPSLGG